MHWSRETAARVCTGQGRPVFATAEQTGDGMSLCDRAAPIGKALPTDTQLGPHQLWLQRPYQGESSPYSHKCRPYRSQIRLPHLPAARYLMYLISLQAESASCSVSRTILCWLTQPSSNSVGAESVLACCRLVRTPAFRPSRSCSAAVAFLPLIASVAATT